MSLIHYEPWSALRRLQRDLDHYVGSSPTSTANWAPAVDIRETAQGFELHADLPGVDPKDIEITMEKGALTIAGERQIETAEGTDERRTERVRGSFSRRFQLPDTADLERIEASSHHGVLIVRIPKKPDVQPRRIDIQVA